MDSQRRSSCSAWRSSPDEDVSHAWAEALMVASREQGGSPPTRSAVLGRRLDKPVDAVDGSSLPLSERRGVELGRKAKIAGPRGRQLDRPMAAARQPGCARPDEIARAALGWP